MYLKSIEIIGFKSFAQRTRLVFEPGITAVVGPNGCGKSNISDAIRWVLGEQRPTALRGSAMTDVIFNGTEARKPLGMAEVSIVFADCESALGTEFNEVTVSRRVFRSGEGQYFLNKKPCRLRDIQRLFMDTGVGTSSYSVMAQGQIDAILSSRPEDRRTIFEEAAGVTKYKADRKEATRKLEQTDANLSRVGDILRELRRQINSLERQVAKAEKFKRLKAELRNLDLFAARGDVAALDGRLAAIAQELEGTVAREEESQRQVAEREAETAAMRAEIEEREGEINECAEAAAQDAANLEHAKDLIAIGEQRIADYRAWADRDSREASEMRTQLGQLEEQIRTLAEDAKRLDMEVVAAREERETIQERTEDERSEIDAMRNDLQARREKNIEREGERIILLLPDPKVVLTSSKIDRKEVKEYVGLARPRFSDEELTLYEQQGRQAIIDKIASLGIIDVAKENAARVLVPMLVEAGFKEEDIIIAFRKNLDIRELINSNLEKR